MLAPIAQPAIENSPAIFATFVKLFSFLMRFGATASLG